MNQLDYLAGTVEVLTKERDALSARLAEAERMLEDIDGWARIGDLDMNQLRVAIGTFLYRTSVSASGGVE
jgi:hypothetical protein